MNLNLYGIATSLSLFCAFTVSAVAAGAQNTLSSDLCRVNLLGDGSITVAAGNAPAQTFRPVFTVLQRPDDPHLRYLMKPELNYVIPSWKPVEGTARAK